MPSIRPATFRRRLRLLEADDFVAFVADLWSARGYETCIDGESCRVKRPEGSDTSERTLAVVYTPYIVGQFRGPWRRTVDAGSQTADADVIVTNASARSVRRSIDADVSIIDADDLYEIALYAIPRHRCRSLFREYLDIDGPIRPPADHGRQAVASEEIVSGVAVWSLIALLVVALGAVFLTTGLSTQISPGSAPATEIEGKTPTPVTRSTPSPTVTATPARTMLAPGLAEDGTLNATSLARAHKLVITGRSYTWVMRYREHAPNRTVTLNETVRVAAPAMYRSDVTHNGTPRFDHPISQRDYYANDRFRFERYVRNNETHYQRATIDNYGYFVGRNANRAGGVLRRYLATEHSRIVGTEQRHCQTVYVVKATGDRRLNIINATTVVWIDNNGFVYRLHRTHQPTGTDDVTVEFTYRYVNVSNTRVDPPPWYEEALNETESFFG
ncbi:MAG: hypothetical protein ABEH65_06790 [Halobacteriales archaeon]